MSSLIKKIFITVPDNIVTLNIDFVLPACFPLSTALTFQMGIGKFRTTATRCPPHTHFVLKFMQVACVQVRRLKEVLPFEISFTELP